MLYVDGPRLAEMLSFDRLVPALHEAFIKGATVPLRHTHLIESADHSGTSLLMPAWDSAGFYGVKIVNIYPGNRDAGLPGLHSTYVLHDARTGVPLALMDGDAITSRRTAAAAALGARYLAREDANSLLVVGAGRVGSLVGPAMASVRNLQRFAVWDIDVDAAARCANAWVEQGFAATVALDLQRAVEEADIVSCATLAKNPFIDATWLRPGSHLDLIGSFTPAMTEAKPECFAQASVWVDTAEAPAKSGDLLNAIALEKLALSDIVGDLAGLCSGSCPSRTDATQRTIFKAVGTGLEDLAAARLAYSAMQSRPSERSFSRR